VADAEATGGKTVGDLFSRIQMEKKKNSPLNKYATRRGKKEKNEGREGGGMGGTS